MEEKQKDSEFSNGTSTSGRSETELAEEPPKSKHKERQGEANQNLPGIKVNIQVPETSFKFKRNDNLQAEDQRKSENFGMEEDSELSIGTSTSSERSETEQADKESSKPKHKEHKEKKQSFPGIKVNIQVRKTPFKFKRNDNGNIMSIHHTIQECNKLIRIRLCVCGFSSKGIATQFVAIDKRGNVFVFDLTAKRFWKLSLIIPKASIIVPHKFRQSVFLVGTKAGQLLLLNVERSFVEHAVQISQSPITEISFAEQHTKRLVLIHAGSEAIIVNVDNFKFTATHRLDFDEGYMSLKFACFIPKTDHIFTCFTNDSIHIWSGATLKIIQKTYPIKTRNLKIRAAGDKCCPPEFRLQDVDDNGFEIEPCEAQRFSEGLINAYNFTTQDGGLLCLATADKYLSIMGTHTFDVTHIFRLCDFTILDKCAFITQPYAGQFFILALTSNDMVVLLDCQCPEFKLIVHKCAMDFNLSYDGKVLAVLAKTGEAEIWNVSCLYNTLMSQRQCMLMLKEALKQPKPLALAPANECYNEDIKKLLKRDRLVNILREHGFYPSKYRGLIWTTLLKLPCNRAEFQQLLKLGTPPAITQRVGKLKFKSESLKRALIKVWSCLANWCKVFAYSEFFPQMIFPFVKVFPKNALVNFEICVTLLLNHFQHWFEFHPLAPSDYLGMCENVLEYYDAELCEFYAKNGITANEFAWPMLSNSFSEVLDEEQWLMIWDNIITCPIYFPIFCVIAYNILQREVILLLPDKNTIELFFHEQNPIDASKLLKKSLKLMHDCPEGRHPSRYFEEFQTIPKNVYPKFLRYPREWVTKHEDELISLQREQEAIDERIRQLEMNEMMMMEELEKGLKAEEHAKRLKEMERLYHDALKREEERVTCQRKMLLLYQKEIRGYKGQVLTVLRESDRRKRAIELEKQMDLLMHNIERERRRNDSALMLAEDELQNQNMELFAQKQYLEQQEQTINLASKFKDDVRRLVQERSLLHEELCQLEMSVGDAPDPKMRISNLDNIEQVLEDIQKEFFALTQIS